MSTPPQSTPSRSGGWGPRNPLAPRDICRQCGPTKRHLVKNCPKRKHGGTFANLPAVIKALAYAKEVKAIEAGKSAADDPLLAAHLKRHEVARKTLATARARDLAAIKACEERKAKLQQGMAQREKECAEALARDQQELEEAKTAALKKAKHHLDILQKEALAAIQNSAAEASLLVTNT